MISAFRPLALLAAMIAIPPLFAAGLLPYPPSPRSEVVDDYFGTKVADPYRWLEAVDTPETRNWVRAQQALTTPFLNALPERKPILTRLRALWNYERQSTPRIVGSTRFYERNDGLQNQAVLYAQVEGKDARALIDPNSLSAEGTTALTRFAPSPSGSKLAYLLAEAGSDWETLRILDTATLGAHADALSRVKFSRLDWTHDEQAVIYSKYPEAQPIDTARGTTFESLSQHGLYLHRLGTPQSADVLLYQPEDASWIVTGQISKDGRYLVVSVNPNATENNRLSIYDLGDASEPRFGGKPVILGADFASSYEWIGNVGSRALLLTTNGAPRKRVVSLDLAKPQAAALQTVVREAGDVIQSAHHISGRLLVLRLHDAAARLTRYSIDGKKLGDVALPGLGDVSEISGEADQFVAYFQFTTFARPPNTYRLGMKSGELVTDWAPKLPFDPTEYGTEQVFYASKDGTRIPMFISAKKGLRRDGTNPTLLYGYGGFNIALPPGFSPQNLAWMEAGGIYAQANLRGGSEYGEAWHRAGTRERKQNVFNDFASAAEYLIKARYTSAKHLGIYGRSNGGLLVGATLNQHPELFAAAVPGVGVMDMLRFHLPSFTIGHAWRDDYGSAETADGFSYLYPYSPVHNVTPGVSYPPTLTLTADHDDRVVPGHSFKYAATMQWANADNPNPQLIRIEEQGGHGAGKPQGKKMDEVADVLAFLLHYTR